MATKLFTALAIVFLAIIVILSLLTALTSASANLANGIAYAAASSSLLVSQCLSGIMVIIALIAGAAIGISVYQFKNSINAHRVTTITQPQNNIPLLTIGNSDLKGYLPGTIQILDTINAPDNAKTGDEGLDDVLFQNWGW